MNEEIVDYRGYIKTLTSLSELYLEAQKAWDIGSTKFIPALSKRIQELKRRILEELPKLYSEPNELRKYQQRYLWLYHKKELIIDIRAGDPLLVMIMEKDEEDFEESNRFILHSFLLSPDFFEEEGMVKAVNSWIEEEKNIIQQGLEANRELSLIELKTYEEKILTLKKSLGL
jgi:hypothetical protein